jgi:hypothetical protein
MAAFLLAGGEKGKRFSLPNSRILIHQPAGGTQGQASDIKIQAEEILRIREEMNKILAKNTGQPLKTIERDTDRDFYMRADEAKNNVKIQYIIPKEGALLWVDNLAMPKDAVNVDAALKYINDIGVDNIFQHNQSLIDQLLEFVQGDDFYSVRSSLEPKHRSSIISIGSPAGDELLKYLLKENFHLVYREGGVRVSVNFYNTLDEVDVLIDRLRRFKAL